MRILMASSGIVELVDLLSQRELAAAGLPGKKDFHIMRASTAQ
jgi:hypothetical protein